MRCHVINCLAALKIVQIARRKSKVLADRKQELVKRKVFEGACSILINYEFDSDYSVIGMAILTAFPDKSKMSSSQNWLPMHFAIALFSEKKISEDDVITFYSIDPLAMHRLSNIENEEVEENHSVGGCTPAHLLCMQKQPDMSLVRYFCLRDPKAFLLCDQQGRCALHLVAMYSESVELLQSMLQIDQKMTKKKVADGSFRTEASALGFLCSRLQFPTFLGMIASLTFVDRTVDIIYDGVIRCLESNRNSLYRDISPGSKGERILDLIQILLSVNPAVAKYKNSTIIYCACSYLRGDLGLAVIKFFLEKNSDGIRSLSGIGSLRLPIQYTAACSSLDIFQFLHKAYPESLSMVIPGHEHNLLHIALEHSESDSADKIAKVKYLCDQCPNLMHMKSSRGYTPLHAALLTSKGGLNTDAVAVLCNADETVVKSTHKSSKRLPLHLIILYRSPSISEVSAEGDCFRLFLRLYPAAAGIKDVTGKTPYDWAVLKDINTYFIRLLLSADVSIDPVKSKNLNFSARREGMFLAFRALSTDVEPSIWSKIRYEDTALLAHVMSYL